MRRNCEEQNFRAIDTDRVNALVHSTQTNSGAVFCLKSCEAGSRVVVITQLVDVWEVPTNRAHRLPGVG